MTDAVEIRHVTKTFPGVAALSDVSFSVRQGEVHAVVGENGAGKCTLMKILGGVYRPDRGEILIDGQPGAHPLRRTTPWRTGSASSTRSST